VLTVLVAVYLKYSKHGYEISVVGESPNTAKYVGINTKAVIIRTLVLCGALCGIAGFLLVSATNHSLTSTSTVGGRGFTGVLISWLGQFNPFFMALMPFLVVFIERGSKAFGNYTQLGSFYANVMTGIFFFVIIAVEFFVNYKFIFREDIQAKIDNATEKIKVTFSKKKTEEVVSDSVENIKTSEVEQGSEEPVEESAEQPTEPVEEEIPATEETKAEEEK
jgi:simple sugar transport system permease protein